MGTLVLLWMLSHTDHTSAPTAPPPTSHHPEMACTQCDAVIRRVLPLLPRQPVRVIVFDTERMTELRKSRLADVDGFVTKGDPAVYLKKQSATFQAALAGPGIWDYAIAITIWHEMAHLAGADERQAQKKEEELWTKFIVGGQVDSRRGMGYLGLLRKRQRP